MADRRYLMRPDNFPIERGYLIFDRTIGYGLNKLAIAESKDAMVAARITDLLNAEEDRLTRERVREKVTG